ncbi:HEAT repeat domain-containing protein [Candidatus Sumerlaeota bacterium]|nr:HEAT repeat domain-containing protein [Candidatus Sumerlaeota bacterium]
MKTIKKTGLFLSLFLVLFILPTDSDTMEEFEKEFTEAASKVKFIMPIDFGVNCFMNNYATKEERETYDRAMKPLMERDYATSDVIRLLRHESPQVRSLAALTLIKRRNPRLLPYIAELLTDNRFAFRIPYQETCSTFWPKDEMPPLREETVSQIASACIDEYLRASNGVPSFIFQSIDPKTFEHYWKERKDRFFNLGWFMADYPKLYHRLHTQSKEMDKVREQVLSIKKAMEKLPPLYREWYLIYLSQYDKTGRIKIATDAELKEWMMTIGRESIISFLRTNSIPVDDPDCSNLDKLHIQGIEDLILKNSTLLLEKEDAYFLLEEAGKKEYPYMAIWWYIGAAQLLPERSGIILKKLLDEMKGTRFAGEIAYHLFRLERSHKIIYLRDWFYNSSEDNRSLFLYLLNNNDLPEKQSMILSLVKHDRFDVLTWFEVSTIVQIGEKYGI